MECHFYPIFNSTGRGKNGTHPIFTPCVPCHYPKSLSEIGTSLKVIFLISKSHSTKPLSVP